MKKPNYFKLPVEWQWTGFICLGLLLFLCWDQVYWWQMKPDYFFGFLTPIFVGYILFERWPLIQKYLLGNRSEAEEEDRRCRFWGRFEPLIAFGGYLLWGLGVVFLLLGAVLRAVSGPQQPASLALATGFALFVLGILYTNSKNDAFGERLSVHQRLQLTGLFLFPALIWIISAPLLSLIQAKVSLFLLDRVTSVVFFVFDVLGLIIEREGNVLVLPTGRVGVAEACSGIRSLMACLFTGAFLGAVYLNRLWKKSLLVIMAMGFAFIGNLGRSLFLTFWAYHYGSESISGFVHDITGYGVLAVTAVALMCFIFIFNFQQRSFSDS